VYREGHFTSYVNNLIKREGVLHLLVDCERDVMYRRRSHYRGLPRFEIPKASRAREVKNSEGSHSKTFPYIK
jgi:hypothetical protein